MIIFDLELRSHDDGSAYLNHWDGLGGNDSVFHLFPDGTVHELSYPDDPDDETEIWTPVDLVARLLELCRD